MTTQELLIRHLQWLWPDPSIPRYGRPGQPGWARHVSQRVRQLALARLFPRAWLTGGRVNAFLDFALDLQHRFDSVEPYASMVQVQKIAVHAAISLGRASWARQRTAHASSDGILTSPRRLRINTAATNWQDIFAMLERWNFWTGCRITRQRAGLSASKLPCRLPRMPSIRIPTACAAASSLGRAALPCADGDTGTAVALARAVALAGPSHRLPKIDVDSSWVSSSRSPSFLGHAQDSVCVAPIPLTHLSLSRAPAPCHSLSVSPHAARVRSQLAPRSRLAPFRCS